MKPTPLPATPAELTAQVAEFDSVFVSNARQCDISIKPQQLTDEWQPYTGGYNKQPYALRLRDGREIPWAWPNAGKFGMNMSRESIDLADVTHVKRARDYQFYGN